MSSPSKGGIRIRDLKRILKSFSGDEFVLLCSQEVLYDIEKIYSARVAHVSGGPDYTILVLTVGGLIGPTKKHPSSEVH